MSWKKGVMIVRKPPSTRLNISNIMMSGLVNGLDEQVDAPSFPKQFKGFHSRRCFCIARNIN